MRATYISRIAFATSVLAIVAMTGFATMASAHVLKTDGAVGAVMHVDPDDDPIAAQPSTFYFFISNKSAAYDPAAYTLTATIQEGSTTLDTETLAASSSPTFTYTFPRRDVYEVTLIGTPTGSAQPFSLAYDVRVDRIAAPASAAAGWETFFLTHLLHVALVVILLVVLLIAVIRGKQPTPVEPK